MSIEQKCRTCYWWTQPPRFRLEPGFGRCHLPHKRRVKVGVPATCITHQDHGRECEEWGPIIK